MFNHIHLVQNQSGCFQLLMWTNVSIVGFFNRNDDEFIGLPGLQGLVQGKGWISQPITDAIIVGLEIAPPTNTAS